MLNALKHARETFSLYFNVLEYPCHSWRAGSVGDVWTDVEITLPLLAVTKVRVAPAASSQPPQPNIKQGEFSNVTGMSGTATKHYEAVLVIS